MSNYRQSLPQLDGSVFLTNGGLETTLVFGTGSAPRVRGTVKLRHVGKLRRRFSPARAGNRARYPAMNGTTTVQPRACGEQSINVDYGPVAAGAAARR